MSCRDTNICRLKSQSLVHRTIEDEFYDLETFDAIKDFHQRAASYQACYNLVRENMHKDHMTLWQIIKQLRPKTDLALARLPPLMLDWLGADYASREELLIRGTIYPVIPFLVASAYCRRLNSAVRKGDFTEVVNGKRAIGGDSAGFLLAISQNFVQITVDCCNWGRDIVKG